MEASSAFELSNALRLFLQLCEIENSRLRLASTSSTLAPAALQPMQVRNSFTNGIRQGSQSGADGNTTSCERSPFPGILDFTWKLGGVDWPTLAIRKMDGSRDQVEGAFDARNFYGCRTVEGDTVSTNSHREERNMGLLLCPTFGWILS